MDYTQIPSPCYVVDEKALRRNLELIRSVSKRSGARIIVALKANATWGIFPIIREYVPYTTASSVNEARLAFEEMGTLTHTYAPVYTEWELAEYLRYSSHITFNSLTQAQRFMPTVRAQERHISCGLRINPEYSEVETALYNPASPGSRLGVRAEALKSLPPGIEGLHFHTLCESSSRDLEKTLAVVEAKFGHLLPQIQWLNMGGGHLMTRRGYDTEHLIGLLRAFKERHPNLELILEPGSAFTWQTGDLVSTVEDIVENHGIRTAMLDVSFACHMPDCLEMPYKPAILGATDATPGKPTYRMGGNSCLAGDYVGDWSFDHELQVGDRIVFRDMIHYTLVKTTMFNGVHHPSIGLWTADNRFRLIREFDFADYRARLS
ncbi:MAG: carboxynorspermidine decarboxylase [Rikenellaceae bacterium]|jgi:carboxynorspermidine decarboxylase|nr:carboxynorspermidine decarboxylase [Rikenellaceae bacterium]